LAFDRCLNLRKNHNTDRGFADSWRGVSIVKHVATKVNSALGIKIYVGHSISGILTDLDNGTPIEGLAIWQHVLGRDARHPVIEKNVVSLDVGEGSVGSCPRKAPELVVNHMDILLRPNLEPVLQAEPAHGLWALTDKCQRVHGEIQANSKIGDRNIIANIIQFGPRERHIMKANEKS
jgi:hypothetical protein